jgi:predicted Rossmann fold flavoprotein
MTASIPAIAHARRDISPVREFDVVVIGAGAAGMMCAAQAGQRGRRALLIEHYHALGEKIRISGGGRCNFTNTGAGPSAYLSQNPDFCRSALARYTARDFVALVERHRIPYHEKKLGQLFCDRAAHDIIAMLKDECDRGRVEWRMPCAVQGVGQAGGLFTVATAEGPVLARSLVIATGGLTVPKIGATPFGYQVAAQFGLRVVPPRPALVPLAFPPEWLARYGDLAGVALDVEVSCNGGRFRENLLFTHRGLSGPAILQISSYWDGKSPLSIDLVPGADGAAWLRDRRASTARIDSVLAQRLPRRFVEAWCAEHDQLWCTEHDATTATNRLDERRFVAIESALHDWRVRPGGTLGYNKAEVTCGGVDTRELSSKTMGATRVPGLYFIGEVVDVTGWLGGYNFQWAWSSAHAAGQFA